MVHVDASGGKSGKSSVSKGETLEDTTRCLGCYADAVVLRHPLQGSAERAARGSGVPVINAGDGTGEHPTQALLDVYTMHDELSETGGILAPPEGGAKEPRTVVVLLGDLKHGRTVHSLAKLLAKSGARVDLRYCSPAPLPMPESVRNYVAKYPNATQSVFDSLEGAVVGANVLYVTRIQRERFASDAEAKAVEGKYVVDKALLDRPETPKSMIIMHPLPRVDEISTDVDDDPRAAYFRQMENGMFVRMAILSLILTGKE